MVLVRSSVCVPASLCWTILAPGEDEPGFLELYGLHGDEGRRRPARVSSEVRAHDTRQSGLCSFTVTKEETIDHVHMPI